MRSRQTPVDMNFADESNPNISTSVESVYVNINAGQLLLRWFFFAVPPTVLILIFVFSPLKPFNPTAKIPRHF